MAPRKKAEAVEAELMAAVPVAEAPEVKEEAPKKTTAKKTAAKKTTTTKAAETAEGEEPKKAPAKKAPAKRTKKAEVVTTVYVQYAGKETAAKDLVAAAKEAYIAAGHKEEDIKTLDVYVKPEESAVYYVVNGEASDDYKIVY